MTTESKQSMTDDQPTDKSDPHPSGDTTVEGRVMRLIEERRHEGFAKYGTTMERTDLDEIAWLRHAQEEACDLAIYLQKLIDIKGGVPFDEPKEEPDGALVIGGSRYIPEIVHKRIVDEGERALHYLRSDHYALNRRLRDTCDELDRIKIGNAALRTQVDHFRSRAVEAEDELRKLNALEARPGPRAFRNPDGGVAWEQQPTSKA